MWISRTILPTLLFTATRAELRAFDGIIGFGKSFYEVPCASACRESISQTPLSCSPRTPPKQTHGYRETNTPNSCFASDPSYLKTLAWCVRQHCPDIEAWKIEKFWRHYAVSRKQHPAPPIPKWTYQKSIQNINEIPTQEIGRNTLLNTTMLVNNRLYGLWWTQVSGREAVEIVHSRAAICLATITLGLPILLAVLSYWLPIPKRVLSKIYGMFIYPAVIRNRRRVPLPYSIGYAPTYGEALYITLILSANILAVSIGYKSYAPSIQHPHSDGWEIAQYIANRCGTLSFVNLMALTLMAGRNNILLWLTNWSHSTYLLLHRWLAYCCIAEGVVHSLYYLILAVKIKAHSERSKEVFWRWGSTGVVALSALFIFSLLPIRKRMYEVFLVFHIALAFIAILALTLHTWYRYTRDFGSLGMDIWLWVAAGFWALDRSVRLLRVVKNGLGKAEITTLDNDYIKVEVRNIEVEGHVYLYFPTLTWRFWESHPFSVYINAIPDHTTSSSTNPMLESQRLQPFVKSEFEATMVSESDNFTQRAVLRPGFSLLVRTMDGTTRSLRNRKYLPVFVEGPYHKPKALPPARRLVCVAGGVGITAVLPTFSLHQGSKKLYWGSRSRSLVEEVKPHLGDTDSDIALHQRLHLPSILEQELKGPGPDVVVQVCGPAQMADEVRSTVSAFVRKSERSIFLNDESFGW